MPRTYKCDVCRRVFQWNPDAATFGSLGHCDVGARQFVVCSQRCASSAPSTDDLEYIVGTWKVHSGGGVVNARWHEWDNKTGRFAPAAAEVDHAAS